MHCKSTQPNCASESLVLCKILNVIKQFTFVDVYWKFSISCVRINIFKDLYTHDVFRIQQGSGRQQVPALRPHGGVQPGGGRPPQ